MRVAVPSLTDRDTEAPVGQAPLVLGHREPDVALTPACASAPVQVLQTGSGRALPAHPMGGRAHPPFLPPSRDSAQVSCSTHKDEGRHADPGGLCQAAASRTCSEQVPSLRSVTRERCGHSWVKGPPAGGWPALLCPDCFVPQTREQWASHSASLVVSTRCASACECLQQEISCFL